MTPTTTHPVFSTTNVEQSTLGISTNKTTDRYEVEESKINNRVNQTYADLRQLSSLREVLNEANQITSQSQQYSHGSDDNTVTNAAKILNSDKLVDQVLQAATQSVTIPDINQVTWANENHLYLPSNELVKRLNKAPSTVQVFDMRDEDAVGGHVKGAIHCGEKNISKPTVLAATAIRALALGEEGLAVFHCMESLRRGPRAAYRLTQLFAKLPDDMPKPQIKILQGGADQWIRNHWESPLVEGYDDDFWGYEAFPAIPSQETTLTHRLYVAPDDGLSPNKAETKEK